MVNSQTLTPVTIKADTVLVLPENNGWGLRSPEDNFWDYGKPTISLRRFGFQCKGNWQLMVPD